MNNFLLKNKVLNHLKTLRPYLLKNKITAYRLINNTLKDFPATVDIYQGNAVIHVFDRIAPAVLNELEQFLKKELGAADLFYKNNAKTDLHLPKNKSKKVIIEEYGNKFLMNLSDNLDVGLFLDHRETRKWVAGQSKNKVVLNTFAYTGSFSVYAAKAGAKKTTSTDLSRSNCDWIKENLSLNHLPPENNWVYKMDVFDFFGYAKKKGLLFDIIIIDPPTFSKDKNRSFSVQKDHPALINSALELLSPSGFILFSNNYTKFQLNKEKLLPCMIKEKTDLTPPDFEGTKPHRCFIIARSLK